MVRGGIVKKGMVRQSHLPPGSQETDTGIDMDKKHPAEAVYNTVDQETETRQLVGIR